MPAIDPNIFTPYSTVVPLAKELPEWVPEHDRERLASYDMYDEIYWGFPKAFKLVFDGSNDNPIYIPTARTIADSTSHYLLKGLQVTSGTASSSTAIDDPLTAFLKRERFYSRFHNNKHAGVVRGDYIFHLHADPNKPEGRRISLTSVDPASYFPIWDPDNPEKRIGVDLVQQVIGEDNKIRVHRLRYLVIPGADTDQIQREEVILEMDGWYKGKAATVFQTVLPTQILDPEITAIPVYHFKNIDWEGRDFGTSELAGFERIMGSINQSISDEEMALALDGLGVFATDAPRPTDSEGNETDWEVAPGIVLQIPSGTKIDRLQGVGSVKPLQDHLKYLHDHMYEASSVFRPSTVDVQTAESGIALAIKFMPTLAKIEQRDNDGLDLLEHLFFDWKSFMRAYETNVDSTEIKIEIGDKLPQNRVAIINELNNMLDRQVISRKFYRQEMKKLGYNIPASMETEILDEEQKLTEARQFAQGNQGDPGTAPGDKTSTLPNAGNKSNNKDRVNESKGTEAKPPATK